VNCDQAFDLLTDPSHPRRAALQDHLSDCPRCRQMQEVLAPALELFESGAQSMHERADSTDRQPALLSSETLQLADQAANELITSRSTMSQSRLASRRSFFVACSRYAAVFLLGASAALGFAISRSGEGETPIQPQASQCIWKKSSAGEREVQVRPRQLVNSCVACHAQDKLARPGIPLDEFSTPNRNDEADTEEAAALSDAFNWHICLHTSHRSHAV